MNAAENDIGNVVDKGSACNEYTLCIGIFRYICSPQIHTKKRVIVDYASSIRAIINDYSIQTAFGWLMLSYSNNVSIAAAFACCDLEP